MPAPVTGPILDRDPWPPASWPDLGSAPPLTEVPGQGRIEPVLLAPLVDDPWLALKPAQAEAAKPKAVAPDDDCAPEPTKPAVVKRAPLAEAAGKPSTQGFSEQVESAKKRFRPPAVIRTPPRDC